MSAHIRARESLRSQRIQEGPILISVAQACRTPSARIVKRLRLRGSFRPAVASTGAGDASCRTQSRRASQPLDVPRSSRMVRLRAITIESLASQGDLRVAASGPEALGMANAGVPSHPQAALEAATRMAKFASTIGIILVCLSLHVGGCASPLALGEPVNDAPRRAALLQACRRPQVTEAVFRTLIRWPGREISLTEVVKVTPEGGFRAAGITDIGSTLYAVQVAPNGESRVLSKSLPFSDRWLLDGLVAELLLPWKGPHEADQLYRQPDGTWALTHRVGDSTDLFIFDARGNWREVRCLRGGHLRCRAFLEWDAEPVPRIIRVDNPANHYHTVRERVSLQ